MQTIEGIEMTKRTIDNVRDWAKEAIRYARADGNEYAATSFEDLLRCIDFWESTPLASQPGETSSQSDNDKALSRLAVLADAVDWIPCLAPNVVNDGGVWDVVNQLGDDYLVFGTGQTPLEAVDDAIAREGVSSQPGEEKGIEIDPQPSVGSVRIGPRAHPPQ